MSAQTVRNSVERVSGAEREPIKRELLLDVYRCYVRVCKKHASRDAPFARSLRAIYRKYTGAKVSRASSHSDSTTRIAQLSRIFYAYVVPARVATFFQLTSFARFSRHADYTTSLYHSTPFVTQTKRSKISFFQFSSMTKQDSFAVKFCIGITIIYNFFQNDRDEILIR